MTILETFLSITPMLYVSIIMMPLALFGFLSVAKKKRTAILAARTDSPTNPGDQLKEKNTDTSKEMLSSLFLAATMAFGLAIAFFVANIVTDYKDSRGIFAVVMPAATFPPAPAHIVPDGPVLPEEAVEDGEDNADAASLTDETVNKK